MTQFLEDPFAQHQQQLPRRMAMAWPHEVHESATLPPRPAHLADTYGVWLLATLCSGGLMASLLWAFETLV